MHAHAQYHVTCDGDVCSCLGGEQTYCSHPYSASAAFVMVPEWLVTLTSHAQLLWYVIDNKFFHQAGGKRMMREIRRQLGLPGKGEISWHCLCGASHMQNGDLEVTSPSITSMGY